MDFSRKGLRLTKDKAAMGENEWQVRKCKFHFVLEEWYGLLRKKEEISSPGDNYRNIRPMIEELIKFHIISCKERKKEEITSPGDNYRNIRPMIEELISHHLMERNESKLRLCEML